MASETLFFSPTDVIDINTLLSLTGSSQWILHTVTPSRSKDRASGLAKNGDEATNASYNTKDSITLVYKCFAISGSITLPSVGVVASSYHIDSVKLSYDAAGWPTLNITAHKHSDGNTHTEGSCNTYTTSLVFPAQFGIPSSISNNAVPPVKQFEMTSPAVAMKSLSFSLGCTHVDETGGTGNWHAGENRDGVESLDVEFTGVPVDEDITIANGWHVSTDGKSEGNTSINGRSLSLVRHITRDV